MIDGEMDYFDDTIARLAANPEVDAIVLGGSRASGKNDAASDYDVYVYLNRPLEAETRREILEKTCSYIELGNAYWELEDDCILNSGIVLELIYRDLTGLEADLTRVLLNCQASSGYSTCLAENLRTARVLFDRNGSYVDLQRKFSFPYPDKLCQNIILKNRELLSGKIPSYDKQISKAVARGDLVSVNHRITEFLASYFDILFALNRRYHPGEKRLAEICQAECELLPEDFRENLEKLPAQSQFDPVLIVQNMVEKLDKILEEQ
jgi:predicted nucleotidyltransferase